MRLEPRRYFAAFLLAALALSGCAGSSGQYPSLAIRDYERAADADADAAPLEPSPISSDLAARVDQLSQQANAAHQAFLETAPVTTQIVDAATGTNEEDNRWSSAQIALAQLDSRRGATAIALGDLDQLYADATLDFTVRDAIAEARSDVIALIASEDETLEQLRSRLDR